eukprot:11749119-Karenia_brevis.AAC.1
MAMAPQLGPSGTAGVTDAGTKALLEALQRSAQRQQAKEEGHLFKPSQWGDAPDDQDMLAFNDDELADRVALCSFQKFG